MSVYLHISLHITPQNDEEEGGSKMLKDKKQILEQERENLLNQWMKKEGDKTKLLLRIMELDDKIEMLKKGA